MQRCRFLFQDYSSLAKQPSHECSCPRPYVRTPHTSSSTSPPPLHTPSPSSPITKAESAERVKVPVLFDKNPEAQRAFHASTFSCSLQSCPDFFHPSEETQNTLFSQNSHGSLASNATEPFGSCCDVGCQTPTLFQEVDSDTPDTGHQQRRGKRRELRVGSVDSLNTTSGGAGGTRNTATHPGRHRPRHTRPNKQNFSYSCSCLPAKVSSSSSPRKNSLFSFNLSEEDWLLSYLVSDVDPDSAPCQLGPALLLAMCTEYCHKCRGPTATTTFLQKVVDLMQDVVWVSGVCDF